MRCGRTGGGGTCPIAAVLVVALAMVLQLLVVLWVLVVLVRLRGRD